nr:hypothetical protein [Chromobacterium sp. Beijing]
MEQALRAADSQGVTLAAALQASGCQGRAQRPAHAGRLFRSAHRTRPVLESRRLPIGVVSGGQGILWLEAELEGAGAQPEHPSDIPQGRAAGGGRHPDAMGERRAQPLPASLVDLRPADDRQTFAQHRAGKVQFSLDLRHPEPPAAAHGNDICERSAASRRRAASPPASKRYGMPAHPFDAGCQRLLAEAAPGWGYPTKTSSGRRPRRHRAGSPLSQRHGLHPCRDGISHNEAESIEPEHAAMGANVLLHACWLAPTPGQRS